MMNCADARPLLDPFCDGALDAGDCALVLDHLKSCQPCQSELNDLEGLRARFREARENCRMPAGLTDKISQTLKKEERAARRQFLKHGANPVFLLAMAAAVFIVGLFALP
ncbi:MAG TPA: zf-HC2 domain-containing protein, partial [Chroococcales cyanobacterium]